MKKGVGSVSQKYGSGGPDPDQHQNVMDPQQRFVRKSDQCALHPAEKMQS
jgi:hypothetical protein